MKQKTAALLLLLIVLMLHALSASALPLAQRLERAESTAGVETSEGSLAMRLAEFERQLGMAPFGEASLEERMDRIEWELGIAADTAERNACTGVSLLDMTPFSRKGVDCFVSDAYCTNSYNGTHDYVICPLSGLEDKASIEYLLDCGYSYLQGTVYIPKHALKLLDTALWERARVSIYGDGELLWCCKGFEKKSPPISFCLDVTGVRFLRIDFSSAYRSFEPLILIGDAKVL